MIFMVVFAGCQGGRYYFANRLQELGIACALLLFMLGAWSSLFVVPIQEWRAFVLKPVFLVFGVMGVSATVFYANFGGNPLYSFFSAREFLLLLGGPGIYLLFRCGLKLSTIERAVYTALTALLFNYLFFYFTMDLKAAFFSSDHTVSNLVTYDEWRGFRLKPPLFAIMLALLSSTMLLFKSRSLVGAVFSILIAGAAVYIWSIVLFRSILATMFMAVVLYPIFFSSRGRIQVIAVITPLCIIAIPIIVEAVMNMFLGADGGNIRAKAFYLAIETIPGHFFLGAGEDSAYGKTYQDIVAPYFYPDDIGWIGTFYKYGLIGALLYLYLHGKLWGVLWRANLHIKKRSGEHHPLIWSLLIWLTALTFNLVLNPGLAYAQGITLGTVGFSLACAHLRSSQI
jgi:hypothetical protein